jgi:glycerol uptake facilitator-like aquaporin
MNERPDLARRAAAEGFGTFALVFAGCGAIVAEATDPGSLGPALVSSELSDLWLYLTAPVLGAALRALAYQLVRGEHPGDPATEGV